MRIYLFVLIYPFILFLLVYAWKDWFPSVGGLVLMTVLLPNPEMPREILGIRGLNVWNVLFLVIVPAWLAGRRREGLRWDLPPLAGALLTVYFLIILVGVVRLALDPNPLVLSPSELIGERFLDPLKFLVPALMIFDGARTRSRVFVALVSILGVYVVLAILVCREVLPDLLRDGSLMGIRDITAGTGFHRNSVSVMLAGASWAVLATRHLASTRVRGGVLVGLATLVVFVQALTEGRGGYLAWVAVGLVLSMLRWRGAIVVAPIAVATLVTLVPAIRERALYGISAASDDAVDERTGPDRGQIDEERLSSGRLKVWPYMIAKIGESPWVGFGRDGYWRSGLHEFLRSNVDATFPHPHNAYLEWLLDNGWLGMVPMVVLYVTLLGLALVLFTDSSHPLFVAAGGVCFALVFAHVIGSATGRTWYPNAESVPMWCAVGLMLRVWVERSRGMGGRRPQPVSGWPLPAGPDRGGGDQ